MTTSTHRIDIMMKNVFHNVANSVCTRMYVPEPYVSRTLRPEFFSDLDSGHNVPVKYFVLMFVTSPFCVADFLGTALLN